MTTQGGCYCGATRYEAAGDPVMKAQCHCRECQYISGGGPNYFMMMPEDGFSWTQGTPATFTRTDIEGARTREYCPTCGTHSAAMSAHREHWMHRGSCARCVAVFRVPPLFKLLLPGRDEKGGHL